MTIYRFEKRTHEEQGAEGWLLVGSPSTYEPIGGMGIAHDLLEHRRNDSGSVEDELLALGAALHVRGEGGWWEKQCSAFTPGENLAPDLARLATEYGGLHDGIDAPGRTQRLDDEIETWINQAVRDARQQLVAPNEYDQDAREVDAFLAKVRGWIRRGYRFARRRYKGVPAEQLSYVFNVIATEADAKLARASFGEVLNVQLNGVMGTPRIWLSYEEEGY